MNIAGRDRLYGEMHHVLRPGGRLALQDVAAGPAGEPHYPTPWVSDKSISFLFAPQATRASLERRRLPCRRLAGHDAGSTGATDGARQSPRHRIAAAARPSHPERAGVRAVACARGG